MLDIIIYGIILYFIYAILFKKSLTEKHREYKKKMDSLDNKINTDLDKMWDDITKRNEHDPDEFPTYRYSGKKSTGK